MYRLSPRIGNAEMGSVQLTDSVGVPVTQLSPSGPDSPQIMKRRVQQAVQLQPRIGRGERGQIDDTGMLERPHRRVAHAHDGVAARHEVVDRRQMRRDVSVANRIVAAHVRLQKLRLASAFPTRFAHVEHHQRRTGFDAQRVRRPAAPTPGDRGGSGA